MTNFKHARLLALLVATVSMPAFAQNIAVVNGKPIPTSRADAMVKQMVQQGQQDTPEMRAMIKDELINREILAQEAEKLGFKEMMISKYNKGIDSHRTNIKLIQIGKIEEAFEYLFG